MAEQSSYLLAANARKQSRLMWGLFLLSLALVSMLIAGIVSIRPVTGATAHSSQWLIDWQAFIFTSIAVAVLILLACLWKIMTLGSDGADVARALGATEVTDENSDPAIRRYRNLVEETALAASLPVPAIFVLEKESGINAFAAGKSTDKAAIAVTRGALELLTRDELGAVVAHEFAHIRNLDMRLNLRLIGLIHGLMGLYVVGRIVMHSAGRSRKGSQLVFLGIALVILGLLGAFFGRVMQAAISRQREYLADADASRFTGDPLALAAALKKIGGLQRSGLQEAVHDELEEARHMMFADLSGKISGWLSTHPPLIQRIRALEPGFNPDTDWPQVQAKPVQK
ncbi:M48 family metalloprotease [Methylophaga lonarensis]|uniref:M48 family metalloprotease n=1 Tax=Methylophaga lonarensis TaxID=999151 RepID=UPI003D2E8B05